MITAEHRGAGRRQASLAALERDAALERVSRARRWVIAAAAALSAAVTTLVASIAPGHSSNSRTQALGASRTGSPAAAADVMPALATPGDLGLQSPSSAPQASSGPSQPSVGSSQSTPPDGSQAAAGQAAAPAPAAAVSGGS